MDSVKRFSTRADNYAKYRPGYPAEVIDILEQSCGLRKTSTIADVGSGTGIITELFLKNGNAVFAIEPNAAMREIAERLLIAYPKFVSVDGTAEETALPGQSVDLIVAAQAFHWFDRRLARQEFVRILKPNGRVALIWNERRLDSTPFLRAYEALLLRYGTDYQTVRHENVASEIADFFAPSGFQLENLKNYQHFDFDSLKGRVLSASYTPEPDHPNFEPMLTKLQEVFSTNERDGTVSFEYETRVYYGHLALSL